jgi:hypothetical protein
MKRPSEQHGIWRSVEKARHEVDKRGNRTKLALLFIEQNVGIIA